MSEGDLRWPLGPPEVGGFVRVCMSVNYSTTRNSGSREWEGNEVVGLLGTDSSPKDVRVLNLSDIR